MPKNNNMIHSLDERFWEKVEKSDSGCWIWMAFDQLEVRKTLLRTDVNDE